VNHQPQSVWQDELQLIPAHAQLPIFLQKNRNFHLHIDALYRLLRGMKLSRERKVLVGVLGLGLSALAVDRLFLADGVGGPQQAQAAAGIVQNTAEVTPKAISTPAANTRSAEDAAATSGDSSERQSQQAHMASLAQLLQQAAQHNQIHQRAVDNADASSSSGGLFASAHHWIPKEPQEQATPGQPAARQQPFDQRYRLDAILASDTGNLAIINGQPYRVGSQIENYRITAIHPLQRRIELTHVSETQDQVTLAFKDDR